MLRSVQNRDMFFLNASICGVLASVSSQDRCISRIVPILAPLHRRIYSASGHGPAEEFGTNDWHVWGHLFGEYAVEKKAKMAWSKISIYLM